MHIYCVDDNPIHSMRIKEVVEKACKYKGITEYEIIECKDGNQLIEQAVVKKPTLITLDINMPGLDGLSTLVKIRQKYRDCVIIMVSSEQTQNIRRHASVARFDADVNKKKEMLERVVNRVRLGKKEPGKINSVLEACASLGMDPVSIAESQGANAFISKPYDVELVSKQIAQVL